MRDPRRLAALIAGLLLLAAPAIAADRVEAGDAGVIAPPAVHPVRTGDSGRQAALDDTPAWRGFRQRHGAWAASWNEATGTPHRAFGPPIALGGAASDAGAMDQAVRAFVAGNPAVFGTPTLALLPVLRVNGIWFVRYRQTVAGVPVLFSDWEFRVSESGRLIAFGADHREPRGTEHATGQLVRAVAREAAHRGLAFQPGIDRVEDGGTWLLPWTTSDGTELRLVYEQQVHTEDPPGNWWTLVDADRGEVLWRHNRVCHAIAGHVSGGVHLLTPTDPLVAASFANLNVDVGGTVATTNTLGLYSAPASGTVTVKSALAGPFCQVSNNLPPSASFSTSSTDPALVDIVWSIANSSDAERDAFYHVNAVHDFTKSVDPAFTGMDYAVPALVNINLPCNAFWDSFGGLFLSRAGGGCANTATIPDVIYHEYGHGINDNLYVAAGSPSGMHNQALHEGMADVNAALIQDNPNIGKGLLGPGTMLRTLDNTNHFPEDDGEIHIAGLIIAGAFWDLRQAIGLPATVRLAHFAKYGIPDDVKDDGVAMSEYFIETLIADDDDANLANGTPHYTQIAASFNAHGIGTGYFIRFTHTPLADQPGTGNYPVTALIHYTAPVGALVLASPRLHYSLNEGPDQPVAMMPTGNSNEFSASIPGQAAGLVRYWISAEDIDGGTNSAPRAAPTQATYAFLAGPASPQFTQTMEADPGWTIGAAGDDATAGIWGRGNPNGTLVDGQNVAPEDDHTPPNGTVCWVTGIGGPAEDPLVSDVDGGKTSLVTHVFDAASSGIFPVIEYYRWYTNDFGNAPGLDYWRTYISNDAGVTWVPVENTQLSNNSWQRILFFVHDYVTPTTAMRMKFVAQDSAAGSLVEAGVDDFRLLSYPATAAVGDELAGARLALAPAAPNPAPWRTTLRFTLPAPGRATLCVYDLGGRSVRTLIDGALGQGRHAVEWNGRDVAGRRVAPGPYFVRLASAGREAAQKVMLVR